MPFRSSVSHPGPSWCLGPGNWWGGGGCLLQCVGCGSTSGFSSLDAGSMPTPVVWNNNVCRQYQNPLWGAAGWESLFERICSVPGKRTFCVFHISLHTCCLFRFSFRLATSPVPGHHPGLRMHITHPSVLILSSSNTHFTFRLLRNTSFLYGSPVQAV